MEDGSITNNRRDIYIYSIYIYIYIYISPTVDSNMDIMEI